MPGGKRLWRTDNGGLVEDGHPDAVLLAYGVDDELSPEDAAQRKTHTAKPAAKSTSKPAVKPTTK